MLKIEELLKAAQGRLISQEHSAHIEGISIDSRTIKPQYAFIAIKGDNFDGHDFIAEAIKKGASCIIVHSPQSVAHSKKRVPIIKVNNTIKALGDIARFQRIKFNIPVIAVTGSNGKTTTKEMIAWALSKELKVLKNEGTKNNQIGLPLALLNLNSSYDIAVLEVGTNHFGEVDYLAKICLPNIGIITNIGPAHLEYLSNLRCVFREKYKIIENLQKPCIGVLNADDNLLNKGIARRLKKPIILGFGIRNKCDFFASNIRGNAKGIGFNINRKYKFTLNTLGYYNIYNALAATGAARIFGMGYRDIALRLENFAFPSGRLEFKKVGHLKFIDDTYNSNPLSLRAALNTLASLKVNGRKVFVMGDMLELGEKRKLFHYRAGKEIARHCDIFITVGRLSKLAASAAGGSGFDSKGIFSCNTTAQAKEILFKRLSLNKDDLVLVKGSRMMRMEEVFQKE